MTIKVMALAPGIVGPYRMERGDIFLVEEKLFSSTWMKKLKETKKPGILKRLFGKA